MPEESTTPDLEERVRAAWEAANRGDLDALMDLVAPDAVFDMSLTGLGRFEGRAAMRRFYEDWVNAYEEFESEVQEVLDLGNGVMFVVFFQQGRPVGSSGQLQIRFAQVSTSVNGVIVRITGYLDIDEGRATAEQLAESRE